MLNHTFYISRIIYIYIYIKQEKETLSFYKPFQVNNCTNKELFSEGQNNEIYVLQQLIFLYTMLIFSYKPYKKAFRITQLCLNKFIVVRSAITCFYVLCLKGRCEVYRIIYPVNLLHCVCNKIDFDFQILFILQQMDNFAIILNLWIFVLFQKMLIYLGTLLSTTYKINVN